MPDLLLTHGYFLYEDPKELQIMKPYAPLGILYLCSHLRAKGLRCRSLRHHLLQPRTSFPAPAHRKALSARASMPT